MQNLIILYNPYYQADTIDAHLAILKQHRRVAFGKIKSKLQTPNYQENALNLADYTSTSPTNPLQLFLTDYADLYVAKVTAIAQTAEPHITPDYYQAKGHEVEMWFIIEDLRELVHDDFRAIRDHYLANFTTPQFDNRTYAIYGNRYTYPLAITMKESANYFIDPDPHYPRIYKNQDFLTTRANLIHYALGQSHHHTLHPDSLENIVFAEIEFTQNQRDKVYDFSGVVLKYAKAIELEAYLFFREFFALLGKLEPAILDITFEVRGTKRKIADLPTQKPDLGTYSRLLKDSLIQETMEKYNLKQRTNRHPSTIAPIQKLRNETVHAKPANLEEASQLRAKILGINSHSVALDLAIHKKEIVQKHLKIQSLIKTQQANELKHESLEKLADFMPKDAKPKEAQAKAPAPNSNPSADTATPPSTPPSTQAPSASKPKGFRILSTPEQKNGQSTTSPQDTPTPSKPSKSILINLLKRLLKFFR